MSEGPYDYARERYDAENAAQFDVDLDPRPTDEVTQEDWDEFRRRYH